MPLIRLTSGFLVALGALTAGVLLGCSDNHVGSGGFGGVGGSGGSGGSDLCPLVWCNDNSECTQDSCDPADPHLCVFINEPVNEPCEGDGVCDGEGTCFHCAFSDCTEARYDPTASGSCVQVNAPKGSPCRYGNGSCDGAGNCDYCDDGKECTSDAYDPVAGMCRFTNLLSGLVCECGPHLSPCKHCDGLGNCLCTADEQCEEECFMGQRCELATGTCEGGEVAPKNTPCLDAGVCDGQGNCVECTGDEQCESHVADDYNDCTSEGECDLETGSCRVHEPIADGTPCAGGTCYAGKCVLDSLVLPCTEQGIRNAIVAGGGPYTFDCDGPTTVVTNAEIDIDKDVVLDGEGKLTLDGDLDHRVFQVRDNMWVELRNLTVIGGSAEGIANDASLTLMNVTVAHNRGIGIWNTTVGRLTMVSSSVSDNGGGGIENSYWLRIETSTISDNQGPGINDRMGPLVLVNSTVSSNEGTGIVCDGRFTIVNSTISANLENGIANQGPTTTNYLHNSTVSGNQGRGIVMNGGLATIANSLIDGGCMGSGYIVSDGHNIESPGTSCGFDQGTDQPGVSADELKLGPLQENGGPTLTHALLPGSVAIDRIPEAMCIDAYNNPITEDQRGVERPQGDACDIGAFELEQP